MIHTSLSPNTERDDLWLAFKLLFQPWKWKRGSSVRLLERRFAHEVHSQHAISFQRGRDALFILLRALGIGPGDEVILQAYTCIVVPNAIQFLEAKPVYVDIEEQGFNIDPVLIEKSITSKTKAVIIQHTFGEPADISAIQAICKRHKLLLIEDCAHALGSTYQGKPVGSFGDAAIWSFGRDKVISSVWGGMVTTSDANLAAQVRELQNHLPFPSWFQIQQALLHPFLFALIKPVYHLGLGKLLLMLSQKIRLIPRVIFPLEKSGKKPDFMPQKMPNALAQLAMNQLQKLDRFHQHRLALAQFYHQALQDTAHCHLPSANSEASWLRYTIRTPKARQLLRSAQKKGIYLGDWYTTVLAPADSPLKKFQYQPGSCPRAEKAAEETVNLPTHPQITLSMAEKVVRCISDQQVR